MRPLRCQTLPGTYEISARVTGDELLLTPGPELNELVLGTLAKTLHESTIDLHAFNFLSNHFHMIVTIEAGADLSRFMQAFLSQLARQVNALRGRSGAVWQRRFHSALIAPDERAMTRRLAYLLAHGVKEGLVATAREWPGVSSTAALADGEPLTGSWLDAAAYWRARRRSGGDDVQRDDFTETRAIPLAPLPCWAHCAPAELQRRVAAMVSAIEAEYAADRAATELAPLGVEAILATSPFARVSPPKRRPAELVHAATREAGRSLMQALVAVWTGWLERAHALLEAYIASGGTLWPFANIWTARRLVAADIALDTALDARGPP